MPKRIRDRREYAKRYYAKNRRHLLDYAKRPDVVARTKERLLKKRSLMSDEDRKKAAKEKYLRENKAKKIAGYWRWRENNPERYRELARKNHAKNKSDPNYRLRRMLRSRLRNALKNKLKSISASELLGCSLESFKIYIESLFEPGMSWANYGRYGWHIDHIIPCALFDLSNPEHQKRCFHFSNLQPMWSVDNLRKGKRVTDPQMRFL